MGEHRPGCQFGRGGGRSHPAPRGGVLPERPVLAGQRPGPGRGPERGGIGVGGLLLSRRLAYLHFGAYTWVAGVPTWGSPKSRAGRRVLPLPEPGRQALLRLKAQQDQDRARAGERWKDTDGRIVTSAAGTPPTPNRLQDTLDRLCARAGVPRLTVHQLRHQCASLLFAAGADVKQVQQHLGHSRASVTLDIYTHLLTGTDGEMARRFERF